MNLDELALDALTEMFNLGVGQAAHALSQISGDSVLLTVPKVVLLSRNDVNRHLGVGALAEVSAVRQLYSGAVNAEAVLMFPAERGLELVQMMVGGELPLNELAEMEQEALAEVGNILLNSIMASVADALKIQLEGSLPTVELNRALTVLEGVADEDGSVLLIDIQFEVASREVRGMLAFLLDVPSQDTLEHLLNRVLSDL